MIDLHLGDCLDVLKTLDADSVDTCVTDPPYGLEFMGKDWDHGVPGIRFWKEVYRVLKPGATLLTFGGTRTWHRLACAVEDAGFEIRDTVMWIYGSGFPKSHDISKAIDKRNGKEREVIGKSSRHGGGTLSGKAWNIPAEIPDITAPATEAAKQWDGWGTALKPAHEPIIVAMKPRDGTFADNALKWGVAGLWIDGGRVGTVDKYHYDRCGGTSFGIGGGNDGTREYSASSHPQGRWPANVIHDGSDEVLAGFPQSGNGGGPSPANKEPSEADAKIYGWANYPAMHKSGAHYGDSGSAARFFYCAKASRTERNAGLEGMEERRKAGAEFRPNHMEKAKQGKDGNPYGRWGKITNHHPTVKPLELMRYLVRLTSTPTGGVVLDPFMGSGTTGMACVMEGRDFIGIEMDAEYMEIAKRRIEWAKQQERQLELI